MATNPNPWRRVCNVATKLCQSRIFVAMVTAVLASYGVTISFDRNEQPHTCVRLASLCSTLRSYGCHVDQNCEQQLRSIYATDSVGIFMPPLQDIPPYISCSPLRLLSTYPLCKMVTYENRDLCDSLVAVK